MKKLVAFTGVALAATGMMAHADKLDEVRDRGVLKCGVSTGVVGFSAPDAEGVWQGFDVGMCRAVAAATLGDPMAVEFIPQTSKTRFSALAAEKEGTLDRNPSYI